MKNSSIRQIACGAYHTLILKHSGELIAFGDNEYGQLGLGDNIEKINIPTCVIKDESIQQIACGHIILSF